VLRDARRHLHRRAKQIVLFLDALARVNADADVQR
jgi:hypothetical protein